MNALGIIIATFGNKVFNGDAALALGVAQADLTWLYHNGYLHLDWHPARVLFQVSGKQQPAIQDSNEKLRAIFAKLSK